MMNFDNMFDVNDKVVLVTGGAGGIGRGIAGAFVAGGAKVYIASRSDLSAAAEELSSYGSGECFALQADLASDDDIRGLAQQIQERENRLNVLINNADLGGLIHQFEDFPIEDYDTMVRVNLRAPFALIKECLPLLTLTGTADAHASVINIVSVDGIRIAGDNDWAYGLSKAGLTHLTRQLAGREGAKHGREGGRHITYNAIAPGPFPGMLDHYLETEEGRAAVGAVTVSGRVGKPEDIGAACIYLASRAGSYVTGAVLPVDGGLLVGTKANS